MNCVQKRQFTITSKQKIELLSPAKNLESGIAALKCGADAVYIGATQFGARVSAGNELKDIAQLIDYAHKFYAKVYVTINTILYDHELAAAKTLICKLYDMGADAIIFQDMALLEMELPPIGLIASTQTHNYQIDKIKFLDDLGVNRIILARELSLAKIKAIKSVVKNAQLEFFVHGALCVCFSGQCYMSHSIGGRSANRGECAQPCRLKYTLLDNQKNVIKKDNHLLSIKDLNLSKDLSSLIDAGITSFKIEGRLKDITYVKNVTSFYRQKLDAIFADKSASNLTCDLTRRVFEKSSDGFFSHNFKPDLNRTFNREYTRYFLPEKQELTSMKAMPTSLGMYLGKVDNVDKTGFTVNTVETIKNGDGICFLVKEKQLLGMSVNNTKNNHIFTKDTALIKKGMSIFRNKDHAFLNTLNSNCCERKVKIDIEINETNEGLQIIAKDKAGVLVTKSFSFQKIHATNKENALNAIEKQFKKTGDTIYKVDNYKIDLLDIFFIPIKEINKMRRTVLTLLEKNRIENYKYLRFKINTKPIFYPKTNLDYHANVTNSLARKFYLKRGVLKIEDGLELKKEYALKQLMACKYCIGKDLNLCGSESANKVYFLKMDNREYKLVFDCKNCQMNIFQN